jgi:hypothetical protein
MRLSVLAMARCARAKLQKLQNSVENAKTEAEVETFIYFLLVYKNKNKIILTESKNLPN